MFYKVLENLKVNDMSKFILNYDVIKKNKVEFFYSSYIDFYKGLKRCK